MLICNQNNQEEEEEFQSPLGGGVNKMFVCKTSMAMSMGGGGGASMCIGTRHCIVNPKEKFKVFKLLVAHVPNSLHNNAQLLDSLYRKFVG